MNDDDLLRYSRHLLLDDIGIEGQQRLLAAHALVIGAGGLGSPVALYLGTAGVGRITLVDDDIVDLTNLQRQIAHDLVDARPAEGDLGGARRSPRSIRGSQVTALHERVDARAARRAGRRGRRRGRLQRQLRHPPGRQRRLRRASPGRWSPARRSASTARSRSTTRAGRRRPATPASFPPDAAFEDVACATMGVFAPLVGIIGSMQAAEALKLLVGSAGLWRAGCRCSTRERWNGPRSACARPGLPGLWSGTLITALPRSRDAALRNPNKKRPADADLFSRRKALRPSLVADGER